MRDSDNRIFSEEEVGRLLRIAIKQQEADAEAQYNMNHGLSLEEIERLAAEAGIDAKYIRVALQNLDVPEKEAIKAGFWGIPQTIEFKYQVPGKLNEDAMERILVEIRRAFKKSRGKFDTLKNSFEWTNSGTGASPALVQAQPVNNNTHITIKERQDNPLVLSYLIPFLFLTIGTIASIAESNLSACFFISSNFSALFFLARWNCWRVYKKRHKVLSELRDKINLALEENREKAWSYGDTSSTNATGPSLSLDAAEGYEQERESRSSAKKTKS
ncbi:MAG: hypothetical protein AAF564_20310 [Bacteroidota bacterium]